MNESAGGPSRRDTAVSVRSAPLTRCCSTCHSCLQAVSGQAAAIAVGAVGERPAQVAAQERMLVMWPVASLSTIMPSRAR